MKNNESKYKQVVNFVIDGIAAMLKLYQDMQFYEYIG
jgi:hypothetical protein